MLVIISVYARYRFIWCRNYLLFRKYFQAGGEKQASLSSNRAF